MDWEAGILAAFTLVSRVRIALDNDAMLAELARRSRRDSERRDMPYATRRVRRAACRRVEVADAPGGSLTVWRLGW